MKTKTTTKITGFRKLADCPVCDWYQPLMPLVLWRGGWPEKDFNICPDCGEEVHTIIGRYIITTTTETLLGITRSETESIELERKI